MAWFRSVICKLPETCRLVQAASKGVSEVVVNRSLLLSYGVSWTIDDITGAI